MKNKRSSSDGGGSPESPAAAGSPGKGTLVQRRYAGGGEGEATSVARQAAQGVKGGGGSYPHAATIQESFGNHDISSVKAHTDGAAAEASEAIGARAYATGEDVAFAAQPDLHTAAHEAAHVVQQRAGVSLPGGVGQEGDGYERHADRAADAVVAGQSAEPILSEQAGGGAGSAVQRDGDPAGRTGSPPDVEHQVHTVVRGDTLWAISRAHGVELGPVIAANRHITNPDLIYPGDTIYVPEASVPGETPGESPGETPGETPGESPGEEPEHAALIAAVEAGDLALAIELLSPEPGTCSQVPVEGLAALRTAGKRRAFFDLLQGGKPYSDPQRAALTDIYHSLPFELKKLLFEARYSVTLGSIPDEDGATTEFTEAELDTLHDQAALLPAGHVEGLATFTGLRRSLNADAEGSYSNPDVDMDEMDDPAAYASTFRHEIGHAVDDALGSASSGFRLGEAGWTPYTGVPAFVAAMGGYGDLEMELQPRLQAAIERYLGGGSTFDAPTVTFEETLEQVVMEAHPEVIDCPDDGSDAVSQEMAKFRAHAAGGCIPLQVMEACQGNNNYWNYQSWQIVAGKAFFVNHWYAQPYSLKASTHADLTGWPNQGSAQAAAFSDAEWFAEAYAVWYGTTVPGTSHEWAGFMRAFFEGPVAALGSPAQAPGGGGSNPKVPR